jgi:hypothetical protein
MPALARLPRLRALDLIRTFVTDAGLEHLHDAPELVSLCCILGPSTVEGVERWKASRTERFRKKARDEQLREAGFVLQQLARGGQGRWDHSTRLNLSQSDASDQDLEYLACFLELEELNLFQTRVSEAGLRHLRALKELRRLDIGDTEVRSLDELAGWEGLRELSVSGRPGSDGLSDAGTAALATLTGLERLELPINPHITDATLRHLAGLSRLRVLNLGWCGPFRDAGLTALSGLNRLEHLELQASDWPADAGTITDEMLHHLAGLNRLTFLKLDHHAITDDGLIHLRGLTKLEHLGLYGTRVTRRGAEGLLSSLPMASISINGGEVKRQ